MKKAIVNMQGLANDIHLKLQQREATFSKATQVFLNSEKGHKHKRKTILLEKFVDNIDEGICLLQEYDNI